MELSPRRQRILRAILPQVVPSHSGTKTFNRIDAGWTPGSGYTTCGGLPAFVAQQLGVTLAMRKIGVGAPGLISMRNGAMHYGAWTHHDPRRAPDRRPRPGDFYLLCSGSKHHAGCNHLFVEGKAYRGADIEHVGVIVDASRDVWITADAGQGDSTMQKALYVRRQYQTSTGLITGEVRPDRKKPGAFRPMRRLCGWMDVDQIPFLDGWGGNTRRTR